MKTFINTAFIASALLASSLATAAEYDSELMSHPREGIMGYGEPAIQLAASTKSMEWELANHPIEGILVNEDSSTMLSKSHCVSYDTSFALLQNTQEGLLGVAQSKC